MKSQSNVVQPAVKIYDNNEILKTFGVLTILRFISKLVEPWNFPSAIENLIENFKGPILLKAATEHDSKTLKG